MESPQEEQISRLGQAITDPSFRDALQDDLDATLERHGVDKGLIPPGFTKCHRSVQVGVRSTRLPRPPRSRSQVPLLGRDHLYHKEIRKNSSMP